MRTGATAAHHPRHVPQPDGLQKRVEPPRVGTKIRPATDADLAYVLHLQRKFTNQLGFLPTEAIRWLIEHARISLAVENGEPCGYLAGRTHLSQQPLLRPITQAAIQYDAQRRQHGLALLTQIEREAIEAGQAGIQACCREGIEANEFWRAAGFKPICIMTPANRRNKSVICWRKPLTNRFPLWFAMPPRRSGYRAFLTDSTRNPRKDYHALIATIFARDTTEQPSKAAETTQPTEGKETL